MNEMPNKVELLSPAGDWECLKAACANGADAVYFGLDKFNARHRAANFALQELPQVMEYLHQRNVRGFVAFNILIFPSELQEAGQYLQEIARAGADAIIIQDPALALLAKRIAPSLEIHASTQMTIADFHGTEFARELGASQVVLARELSIEQVARIGQEAQIPLEVFVHGALCVAYSGQCLTSEALGGRSANRGQCAQACRLPYEMLVDGGKLDLGDRAYLLSPQDLAGHEQIPELIQAGVRCFKIEGRMKGPAYVAATTKFYREAIDKALASQPFSPTFQSQHDLSLAFSRGFTPGFFQGNDHQRLVQGRFPKNRGLLLGTVIKVQGAMLVFSPHAGLPLNPFPLQTGDGIVIDLGKPAENEPGGRVERVVVLEKANQVEIHFNSRSHDVELATKGSLVWKTDDPEFKRRMASSFAREAIHHREKLRFHLRGKTGGALTLEGLTAKGQAQAEWSGPLETARTLPLQESQARQLLGRLGNTPFELAELTLELEESPMVPAGVLNSLRREVVEKILAQKKASASHALVDPDPLATLRQELAALPRQSEGQDAQLTILVRTLQQLESVLQWAAEQSSSCVKMIYCDFENTRLYPEAVALAREAGIPLGLATLRIQKPGEEGFLNQVLRCQPDGLLIRNISALREARLAAPQIPLIGDWSLNAVNDITCRLLLKEGLVRLSPGNDLNATQLLELLQQINPEDLEIPAHLHMPMFHMEHCVYAAFLSKGKDHRDCGRPCEKHRVTLRDRVGAEFPVGVDAGCRNTVYNSVAQSAAEFLKRFTALGARFFRLELLQQNKEETWQLLDGYAGCLAGKTSGKKLWQSLRATNQFGLTRGTLNLL
ncbi:MAG: U32 family peptidase [Gemmataceae bacterium]|nr:U32 family peptidase [Gemmataceae bacterium]